MPEPCRPVINTTDGIRFAGDPIYKSIHGTLEELAKQLRPPGSDATFTSPFFTLGEALPNPKAVVLTSHPLGGCPMGESVDSGVVDEWGRVYRKGAGKTALYRGLYITDGSTVPTALGVNPSLTISAMALRAADKILAEWDEIGAGRAKVAAAPVREMQPV